MIRASEGNAKRLVVKLPPIEVNPSSEIERKQRAREPVAVLDDRNRAIEESNRALGILGKWERVHGVDYWAWEHDDGAKLTVD